MKKKKIIFILLFIVSICSCGKQEPFMDYVFSWDGDSAILGVELTYSAAQKDSTIFIFGDPSFGGQTDIFNVIKNIRCSEPEVLKTGKWKPAYWEEAGFRIAVHRGFLGLVWTRAAGSSRYRN